MSILDLGLLLEEFVVGLKLRLGGTGKKNVVGLG